jgi:hypothetical protein
MFLRDRVPRSSQWDDARLTGTAVYFRFLECIVWAIAPVAPAEQEKDSAPPKNWAVWPVGRGVDDDWSS